MPNMEIDVKPVVRAELEPYQWTRISRVLTTWLLDYADPADGDWPERDEYKEAIDALHSALGAEQGG